VNHYEEIEDALRHDPKVWLVTGAAGFIGSNLVEHLLELGQMVVGLDNFSTGSRHNVDDVCAGFDRDRLRAFYFVPRSMDDPIATNASNVDGFLNMLVAARDAGVERFVYAASSSTYGDQEGLPKVEEEIGRPLSPYAVTKRVNELYADVFQRAFGLPCVGLRYFNVFGPRQDPEGAYAAVIPSWIGSLLAGEPCHINGDGLTSRDFCYVANAIQANILAAVGAPDTSEAQVYNVACGSRTTLNELFHLIRDGLARWDSSVSEATLGFRHTHDVAEGLDATLTWFVERGTSGQREALHTGRSGMP
jgi:UDP-N-acetylglucosamine 4-epimerase